MAYEISSGRGIHDANMDFCTAQSIPTNGTTAISEHVVDLGESAPHMGGRKAILKLQVTTLFADASGSPKVDVNLVTDAVAATTIAGGWVTLSVSMIRLPADSAKGKTYRVGLPLLVPNAYERYLALSLSVVDASTLISAGAIDAWIDFD